MAPSTVSSSLLLGDISEGAGAQGAFRVDRFVVHREHERGDLRIPGLDFLDEVEAVLVAERKIDDHQVRLAFPHSLEGGDACADRAVHREARLGLDEGDQPATQYGMIVDDEKPLLPGGSAQQG